MNIDRGSIAAVEFHAEQLWDATVGLMARAAMDGAHDAPTLPVWRELTDPQRSAFIHSPAVQNVTIALCGVAAHVAQEH